MNRSFFAVALLAVAFGTIACGGGSTGSASPNPAGSPAAVTPPAAVTKGSAAVIHLELSGASGAGTFDLNSSETCKFIKNVPGNWWTAGYKDTTSTKIALVGIAVDVEKSPPTFTFNAITGAITGPDFRSWDASTMTGVTGLGSGTASAQDGGTTAKISINGKTKEGYGVVATVQCNKIERLG